MIPEQNMGPGRTLETESKLKSPLSGGLGMQLTRRRFLAQTAKAAGLLGVLSGLGGPGEARAGDGEILYNGIQLPTVWPPQLSPTLDVVVPPYITSPPRPILIDLGRQLFVDDFMIEQTDLVRVCGIVEWHPANPILRPDKAWELQGTRPDDRPCAMAYSDGVWYDSREQLFKMWYMGGYRKYVCLAVSTDGINWDKPGFDVLAGTNVVLGPGYGLGLTEVRDSSTVWIDENDISPARRFKMFLVTYTGTYNLKYFCSSDGIHWGSPVQQWNLGASTGDRTTVFQNPFRRVWGYSIRDLLPAFFPNDTSYFRGRRYWECRDLTNGPFFSSATSAFYWCMADTNDGMRVDQPQYPAQLYNVDCFPYESLMMGLFSIWKGQPSDSPKYNQVCWGASRDGFYWDRVCREPLARYSDNFGEWNYRNVQSVGGGCLVVGDNLFLYFSGRDGVLGSPSNAGVCSTGLGMLRRDGFCGMASADAPGTLTTRPVRFSGLFLFVNAQVSDGELRVEVLDQSGNPISTLSRDECIPFRGDSTCQMISWQTRNRLSDLSGQNIRFRFHLLRGRIYSFWVSQNPSGASQGYVGAGGPDLGSYRDLLGGQPRLNASVTGRKMEVTFRTEPHLNYHLEASEAVPASGWQPVGDFVGNGHAQTFTEDLGFRRFYRLRVD